MTDILFGQSYYLRFDAKLWQAMQPFPPLGTLYAASYMRTHGYDVALFDAMLAESEVEWQQALAQYRPRYAVLFEDNFNYLSKMCLLRMRQAAFTMIGMAQRQGCMVIVCGADASDHAPEYLAQGVDYVLVGEGEITLGELLDHLEGRGAERLQDVLGLVWRDASGQIVRTPRRPDLRPLDDLPLPAWDLVDISRYRRIWLVRHGYYAMNLVTTRGCPFHCNWCAKPIWGQRYNVRSPENVVAELAWLQEQYRPDFIWFVDDIFGLKPGWVERFAILLEEQGLHIPFKCLGRVDLLLRQGEIAALKRAGAQVVWVGAESGAQKILDAMDKGTRVEQIYAAALGLHTADIQVGFFLQFGYPGESRQDIERTLQMVRDCAPDDIGMSVSYPLPGTKFYQAVRQQLGERQNWYDSEDLAMLYQGPFTTAFYRQLHRRLHCEFRRDKAWRGFIGGYANPQFVGADQYVSPYMVQAKSGRWLRIANLARWVYYSARLPLEGWRLARLSRLEHQGVTSLPPSMTPDAAAQPAVQAE